MKKSHYLKHYYNHSNEIKCLFLRQDLGMEGYGIFWYLMEQLANAGGELPIRIIPWMAIQMKVTQAKVEEVVFQYELFKTDDNNFYFIENLNLSKDAR